AGRRHEHELRALEPALAFAGFRLGDVEPLPRGLVDVVVAVDVPAGGETGELVVEELDRLVGIDGGTTCQVVGRGASADPERLVVAGAAGVADDDRLVLGGRLFPRSYHVGQPVHL